jgi:hypothetical protein
MHRFLLAICLLAFYGASMKAEQATVEHLRQLSNIELLDAAKDAHSVKTHVFSLTSGPHANKTVNRKDLFAVLKERGIYEPFGAVFNAAATFGDAGTNGVPAAQTDTIQTKTLGVIDWESEHYHSPRVSSGDDGFKLFRPEFSFGGRIGFAPALILVDLANGGTPVTPGARPMLQEAFVWDIAPRVNLPVFSKGELSALGRIGQTFLTSDVSSFKQGDASIVATPVNNNLGRAAVFYETGLEFRMFNQEDLFQTHLQKSYLTPAFTTSAGIRNDNRFNKDGALAQYNAPEKRWFFRMVVNLVGIVRQKAQGDTADPFNLKFGVDYDRPRHDARVPAATRYIISSDIDIMKLLRGGQ